MGLRSAADVSRAGRPAGRLPAAAVLVSRCSLAVLLGSTGLTLALFALWPGLDLETSAAFYLGDGRFAGQTPAGGALRWMFTIGPFAICAVLVGLYGMRRLGVGAPRAPDGRAVLFLLVSLVAGPGLLVNAVLKDHSHRPRPMQVVEFGGTLPFRPVGRFDGECLRNCSFVSGEGSTGFWTLAPALLAPPPVQPLAVAAALAFGTGAGLLRIAFGGHFLSDTILSALLTWIVIIATWWSLFGIRPPAGGPPPGRRPPPGSRPPPVAETGHMRPTGVLP